MQLMQITPQGSVGWSGIAQTNPAAGGSIRPWLPKLPAGGDRFGAEKPPYASSDAERLERTIHTALTMFTTHRSPKALINALSKLSFPDPLTLDTVPIAIYDGSEPGYEWVNDLCHAMNYRAFFHIPSSRLYPPADKTHQTPTQSTSTAKTPAVNPNTVQLPAIYTQEIVPQLERERRPAIFIRKDADLRVLQHEGFHALQHLHGLPAGTTPQADQTADAFLDGFNRPISRFQPINVLHRTLKGWLCWVFQIPYILLKSAFTGLFRGKPPAETTPTAYDAIQVKMNRECEVDKFQIRYGGLLGLTWQQRLQALDHLILEGWLQKLRALSLKSA